MEILSLYLFMIIFSVGSSSSVSAYNVPAIFTFGDSIFDVGTNQYIQNCTVQANFAPYGQNFFHHPTGRFTNGRNVIDFLSQYLGIDLQKPYLQAELEATNGSSKGYPSNGINFASAGSGVLTDTNKDEGVLSIQIQLQQFQNLVNQNKIDKKLIQQSLFMFQSGSNDIFNYFLPFSPPTLDPGAFVQAMLLEVKIFVDQIYKLGARRIGIMSLGPVGCVPARVLLPRTPINRCYGKMNKMIKNYNLGLESLALNDIPTSYPGAIAVYGAVYNIVQLFHAIPQHYGFSNTSSACCGEGTLGGMSQCGTSETYTICEDPNKFIFWDFFHPSEHTYKLLAKTLWAGRRTRIRPLNLKSLSNITVTIS